MKKAVKIKELRSEEMVAGATVTLPFEVVKVVSSHFANTLYGYFIGKRLAFKLVENYVMNTWAKYGLRRVQLHEDFFLFQFDTKEGMESAEVKKAPVWVKLHHVPIVAYSEVGLSLITTQIGRPIMLDSYTSNMCLNSWGRSSYARALIEVSAEKELIESIVVAIPLGKDKGHSLATVKVEYEWQPPRCSTCCIFDHVTDQCPKIVKEVTSKSAVDSEGFIEVKKKKNKVQQPPKKKHLVGVQVGKSQPNMYYRFDDDGQKMQDDPVLNVSDSEVDEEIMMEDSNESHVMDSNLHRLCSLVFRHWDWSSNGAWCNKGTRIILGWNHNDVDVVVLTQDDQAIHTRVWLKAEKKELFCSFVYAHNRYDQRRTLWKGLCRHKLYVRNRPWCLMGDFNAALYLEDTTAGGSSIDIAMREFKDCVADIEVLDVQKSSLIFVGAHAVFKPYRISDHSPSILSIPTLVTMKPKPFKFFNFLTSHDRFLDTVLECWQQQVSGFLMFRVVKKLKLLKKPLRKLLYEKGNLYANVVRCRDELDSVQTLLDIDPYNTSLRAKEAACVVAFNEAALLEERMLKQRAKITWLKEGDSNSTYFHKAVKSRVSRSRIDAVTNIEGVLCENEQVPVAFVTHYEAFLGLVGETNGFVDDNLFKTRLHDQIALNMIREVTTQEVKQAMFSMGDDKSPGPDGYTVAFFKEAWEIVATDVTDAVREFFTNGKLLKELNHTIIALIPKIQSPLRVNDYRPISCCNVLFKCISKILANRIKHSLEYLVSPNQSAFVPGRSISNNILLTQEIMHNYHLNRGTPRCAFKVDIQKAYHTVDWEFLRRILHGFGFHARIVSWIMECVSTTSYSICINGNLHGYFKGNRGLRQGDPLSLYLFTLIMEVLTLMLHRRVLDSGIFTYHMYCSRLDLINLCFADDLFIFTYRDVVHSAGIIKEALDEFKNASGLTPSLPKSTAYFCYIRMEDWKNKSLSIAGRLQLIASVIGNVKRGKAKVAWEVVCLPKQEGGLGIRRLDHFNSALMVSHVWKLLTLKESLWVKWIHEYKLKGRSFWDIPMRGNMSWSWRKLLQLRPLVREFFWSKIGDGSQTSLWFDQWCDIGPLCYMISTRDMYRACLTPLSKVKNIIYNGSWNWPMVLIEKYPFLATCSVLIVNGSPDAIVWRSNIGFRLLSLGTLGLPFGFGSARLGSYDCISCGDFFGVNGMLNGVKLKLLGRWCVRRLDHFNSALLVSHVWKLLTLKESLWIGYGSQTSLWFDRWCDIGPLCYMISTRDMYRAGLTPLSKVKDIIYNGSWNWPVVLIEKYPFLATCSVPIVNGSPDAIVWHSNMGDFKPFSVSQVWSSIRPRDVKVDWHGVVWFQACIPRHAFNLWLVVKRKLKTQDRIGTWDVSPMIGTVCSLCEVQPDSHEHLFFDCPFSHGIWNHMKVLAGINILANDVYSIIDYLLPYAERRTSRSVIAKLVVAASTYFIWQERNRRLFKNNKRTLNQVIDCIMSSVRLKLMSCKFKRSRDGETMARKWDLPTSIFVL
ncbi:hypothetical protein Tco_0073444 [Tanacetum coccineum]